MSAARIAVAMSKQHYFFKLIPPRPTFMQDMADEGRRLMDEHRRYFQEHFAAGRVLLFGPVMQKEELSDSACWKSIAKRRGGWRRRPIGQAGLNTFEICPMQVSAARAKEA